MSNLINVDKIKRIRELLEEHETMGGSYFWTPPQNASGRRSYERNHSFEEEFTIYYENSYRNKPLDNVFKVIMNLKTTCSCRNVYYRGIFTINGKVVNARKMQTFLNKIEHGERISKTFVPLVQVSSELKESLKEMGVI